MTSGRNCKGRSCTPTFPGPSASRKPGLRKQFTSSQLKMVGETGFEPATSGSQSRRSTKLSYSPSGRGDGPRFRSPDQDGTNDCGKPVPGPARGDSTSRQAASSESSVFQGKSAPSGTGRCDSIPELRPLRSRRRHDSANPTPSSPVQPGDAPGRDCFGGHRFQSRHPACSLKQLHCLPWPR